MKLLSKNHQTIFTIMFQQVNQFYQTGASDKLLHMPCRTEYFTNSYFPYAVKKKNNLNSEIDKLVSYEALENTLLKIVNLLLIGCIMFPIVLQSNSLLDYVEA